MLRALRSRAPPGRFRLVAVDASGDEDDEFTVAPRDRSFEHCAVNGRSRNERDAFVERVELADTLFPADANDLVVAIERMLHHVLPELSGGADDADPHCATCALPLTRVP